MKYLRELGLLAVIVSLTGVFFLLLASLYPQPLRSHRTSLAVLTAAFVFSQIFAVSVTLRIFGEFAQHLYDLAADEPDSLVARLVFGGVEPTLEVREGRINPDGSVVLRQVGGPGKLRVAHDSAVITQRVAYLHRILGPGEHPLEPFEKVWEVIDLRPQRRSVRVEFMTCDGLPVYCQADIRFRIDGGHQAPGHTTYSYTVAAALGLATLKQVRPADDPTPFQNWPERVADLLRREMQNVLERYSLDDFLNPRYWLPPTTTPVPPPRSVTALERRITNTVRDAARHIGVAVESVRLGPVLPSEGAISQQWLEFWQANMQRFVDADVSRGDAIYADLLLQAQVSAKVELVTMMVERVHDLSQSGMAVPSELIMLDFVDVVRSIAQRNPAVQQTLFTQAEKLMHIVQDL